MARRSPSSQTTSDGGGSVFLWSTADRQRTYDWGSARQSQPVALRLVTRFAMTCRWGGSCSRSGRAGDLLGARWVPLDHRCPARGHRNRHPRPGPDRYVAQVRSLPTIQAPLLTPMDTRTLDDEPRQVQALDLQSKRVKTLVDRTEFAHLALVSPKSALLAYSTHEGEALSVRSANGRRLWSRDHVAISEYERFPPAARLVRRRRGRLRADADGRPQPDHPNPSWRVNGAEPQPSDRGPGAIAASPRAVAQDRSLVVIQPFQMPSQADQITPAKFGLWGID